MRIRLYIYFNKNIWNQYNPRYRNINGMFMCLKFIILLNTIFIGNFKICLYLHADYLHLCVVKFTWKGIFQFVLRFSYILITDLLWSELWKNIPGYLFCLFKYFRPFQSLLRTWCFQCSREDYCMLVFSLEFEPVQSTAMCNG